MRARGCAVAGSGIGGAEEADAEEPVALAAFGDDGGGVGGGFGDWFPGGGGGVGGLFDDVAVGVGFEVGGFVAEDAAGAVPADFEAAGFRLNGGDPGAGVEADDAAEGEADGLVRGPVGIVPGAQLVVAAGPAGAVADVALAVVIDDVAVGEHGVDEGVDAWGAGEVAGEDAEGLHAEDDGVAGVDFRAELFEGEAVGAWGVGVEVRQLGEGVGGVAAEGGEGAEAGLDVGDGDSGGVGGFEVVAAAALAFEEVEGVAVDVAAAFAGEVLPFPLVEADEVADAIGAVFGAAGGLVGVGSGVFVVDVIIVVMAGEVFGAAVEAGLGGPEGEDAAVVAEAEQGGFAAVGGAGVEVGEAMAVPVADEVAEGGAVTADVPCVIGDLGEVDIFEGEGGWGEG